MSHQTPPPTLVEPMVFSRGCFAGLFAALATAFVVGTVVGVASVLGTGNPAALLFYALLTSAAAIGIGLVPAALLGGLLTAIGQPRGALWVGPVAAAVLGAMVSGSSETAGAFIAVGAVSGLVAAGFYVRFERKLRHYARIGVAPTT